MAPSRPRPSGPPGAQGARGEERRRQAKRRGRVMLAGSVVVSALMLAAWFPFGSLLAQHRHLNNASAQLSSLTAQDKALAHEQAALTASGDVARLAREQYQLVEPGQRLVQVLPPSGTPSQSGAGQAPYPGDPGLTKPVAPSAIALLPSATTTTSPSSRSASHAAAASPVHSVIDRIVNTLAFWRR